MSVGVKEYPPVKNPQSPVEYPEGTEYVEPQVVYDPELVKELSGMWMSIYPPPAPKVGPWLEQ